MRRTLAHALALAAVTAGSALGLPAAPAAAATLVQVSASPAQTIQHIGASGAWWVNDLGRFSVANQQRAAELLFGPTGLQLSAYRYNIGGGGVGVADTDRSPDTFLVSPGSSVLKGAHVGADSIVAVQSVVVRGTYEPRSLLEVTWQATATAS